MYTAYKHNFSNYYIDIVNMFTKNKKHTKNQYYLLLIQ